MPRGNFAKSEEWVGQKFGRLTVVQRAENPTQGKGAYWLCRCDCGGEAVVRGNHLKNGVVQSCKCLRSELSSARATTHGKTNSPEWNSWKAMLDRCHRKNHPAYERYGGRGIVVCERWLSFGNFFADMGERAPGTTLDRINSDGNYEPGNCRWATAAEQNNNSSWNHPIVVDGVSYTPEEVGKLLQAGSNVVYKRRQHGWSDERILRTPVQKKKRRK